MSVHIREVYYYKNWNQPILTSNDGNSDFIVSSSDIYTESYAPWKSFSSLDGDYDYWLGKPPEPTDSSPKWFKFVTYKPLKISNITMVNRNNLDGYITKFIFQGSNDGFSWEDLTPTLVNTNTSKGNEGGVWTISVNSRKAYTQHRWLILGDSYYTTIGKPTIEAVELSDESDYDIKEDFGLRQIKDVYSANTKIGKIYKGSVLVYTSSVNDGAYIKQPDFTKIVSFSENEVRYASNDVWVNVCCNSAFNYNFNTILLEICKKQDFSSNVLYLFKSTASNGITWAKGGSMFYVPKGWYYRSNSTNIRQEIRCVSTSGKLPYKYRDSMVKAPNYETGVSVSQNQIAFADKDKWLRSYGSTRNIEVSKNSDMSSSVKIAGGVISATVEPSCLVFIEKGLYFRTSGTENTVFNCLEV